MTIWEILWGIIKLIGYTIYYVGLGLYYTVYYGGIALYYVGVALVHAIIFIYDWITDIFDDKEEVKKFIKKLGEPIAETEVNTLTPLKELDDINLYFNDFGIEKVPNKPLTYKYKSTLNRRLKYKLSIYEEGLLIFVKKTYYLIPYTDYSISRNYDSIKLDDDQIKKIFYNTTAINVLKYLLKKNYKFSSHTDVTERVIDTRPSQRKYKKDGTLDQRYSKQNSEGWELWSDVTVRRYLWFRTDLTGVIKARSFSIKFNFKEDELKAIYRVLEKISSKQNKTILPIDVIIDDSNNHSLLLNDNDINKINELVSKSTSDSSNSLNQEADTILKNILQRHNLTCTGEGDTTEINVTQAMKDICRTLNEIQ